MDVTVRPHTSPECPDLAELVARAEAEGYRFVANTVVEWEAGINRFDREGEVFFLAHGDADIEDGPVGMCGLNLDPYVDDPRVGRLRHLYVHPDHRRSGIAEVLVAQCLAAATDHFDVVRLRTSNPAADALYRSMGFHPVDDPYATHQRQPPTSVSA